MLETKATEMFKATIRDWREERSYLILKKVIGHLSYGGTTERFEVVKRWSAQGWGEAGILTDTLKGVEFTRGELKGLSRYDGTR